MIVKVKDARVHIVGGHTLVPGNNVVADEYWHGSRTSIDPVTGRELTHSGYAHHPIVKHHLDEGIFEVLEGPAADKAEEGSLSSYKEKEALNLVKDTFNRDLLLSWQANEKRPKVITKLNAQLKALGPESEEEKVSHHNREEAAMVRDDLRNEPPADAHVNRSGYGELASPQHVGNKEETQLTNEKGKVMKQKNSAKQNSQKSAKAGKSKAVKKDSKKSK